MSQLTFADADFAEKGKTTRKERFLAEMEQVVPWGPLQRLIDPVYPEAGNGRRPYSLATMLRIYLMQNWFSLSDPAMEDALYDIAALRQFAGLSSLDAVPDETTILKFRHQFQVLPIVHNESIRANRCPGIWSATSASRQSVMRMPMAGTPRPPRLLRRDYRYRGQFGSLPDEKLRQ